MFGVAFITIDLLIILGAIVALYALGLKAGKRVLVSMALGIYPAFLIYSHFPYYSPSSATGGLFLFVVVYLICIALLKKSIGVGYDGGSRLHINCALLAVSNVFILLAMYMKYLALSAPLPYVFSGTLVTLLTATIPFGILLMLPLLIILFAGKH